MTKLKFLCAYNPNTNKFFGLESDFATTNPLYVDSPYDAEKIRPYSFQKEEVVFSDLKPAPYYFENSSRMRDWLEGFIMVIVEMTIDWRIVKQ